ncbi:MAG: phosphatidylglycerophosphatase A [Micavibrio sp.]|nr:phosphatidylglycerophosphatase A [Micavibrio sp.]
MKKVDTKIDLDFKNPAAVLATWFGTGLLVPAPGTWGTLAALPFGIGLMYLGFAPLLIGILVVTELGRWSIKRVQAQTKSHDAGYIVIDEVAGMWITMLFCDLNAIDIGIGFILFRLIDIIKPWPIGALDKKIQTPFGVMLDDILAGLAAGLLVFAGKFYNVW